MLDDLMQAAVERFAAPLRIAAMPNGPAKVDAARHFWESAQNDSQEGYREIALTTYIDAAALGGRPDLLLALFPLYVSMARTSPEAVNSVDFARRFVWVVGTLVEFPEVPLERIAAAMEAHRQAVAALGGKGVRSHLSLRWQTARDTGDPSASALLEQFTAMPRDECDICEACEAHALVEWYLPHDRERACGFAAPLMDGRLSCTTKPGITHALMALPALRAGDPRQADRHWCAASAALAGNPAHTGRIGHLLRYLAATGSQEAARSLLLRSLPWLESNPSPYDRMHFCAGAAVACGMLDAADCEPLALAMPPAWQASHGQAPAGPAALAEWFSAEAGRIASAFDRRNGNTFCSTQLVALAGSVDK